MPVECSADSGTGPHVIESFNQMDDKSKEGSGRHGNDAYVPIPAVASWQGH